MEDVRTLHVLLFHHVHDGNDGAFRITPTRLRRQLEVLMGRGYVPISLDRLLAARDGGALPPNPFLVTFDDAYDNVFVNAHPILRDLEVPGTLFVISSAVGGVNSWDAGMPRHRHMDVHQIRQLAQEGWTIGSHSRTHPMLTGLDDAALEEELAGSRFDLEAMVGVPVRAFAYPGGHRDARVKAAASRHYELAFSTDVCGPYPPGDPYDLSRFDPSFCDSVPALLRATEAGAVRPPRQWDAGAVRPPRQWDAGAVRPPRHVDGGAEGQA